jgi:hypothetical protein
VYDEANTTNLINVASGANVVGVNSVAVSAVTLNPGNYYVMVGWATTTTATLSMWTSSTLAGFSSSTPAGKKVLEGTVTHASGACDATLGAVTATISSSPIIRFDN